MPIGVTYVPGLYNGGPGEPQRNNRQGGWVGKEPWHFHFGEVLSGSCLAVCAEMRTRFA